jgi:hypothetical protein
LSLLQSNIDAVRVLLQCGADVNAKCHGTPVLQLAIRTAAQPEGYYFGMQCFQELMASPALTIVARDDNNWTALHVAAQHNFAEMLQALLDREEGRSMVNYCSQATGLTALHVAALANATAAAEWLCKNGAQLDRPLVTCGSTALHCAATAKSTGVFALLVRLDRALLETRDLLGYSVADILAHDGCLLNDAQTSFRSTFFDTDNDNNNNINAENDTDTTTIFYGDLCGEHHTCLPADLCTARAPPENRHRLHVLVDAQDGLLRCAALAAHHNVRWAHQHEKCALADVLRVHEWSYVRRVQAKCEGIATAEGLDSLDGDTTLSRQTFDAALVAAGAVCAAVDAVVGGHTRNAFCAVRPPGHHAGPLGAVPASETGSESHGFCFLNNVSIGAAYAMNRHRDHVKKVAIVDFGENTASLTESSDC